jgi:dihydrolipoamide dehydrogenase
LSTTTPKATPARAANETLDVLVIGAGPGGYVAAIHGAQRGLKVGLVERDSRLGGTCLLRGCIPTKALLESASLFDKIKHANKFGIQVGAPVADFPAIQKYKERVVQSNARGVEYLTNKYGVQVLSGHARLTSPTTVSLTRADGATSTVTARHIVLATGSRCSDLPFLKADHERILNSDDILNIQHVPARLIVMGAGAVGSEFASIFARLGAKVDLIELQDRVLPMEDDEVCAAVAQSFKKQGINVLTSTKVGTVKREGDTVQVEIESKAGAKSTLTADYLLVAVGRAPVTDDLGLATVGVKTDSRGYVEVDTQTYKTSVPNVFAIGDIIKTPAYAHTASHEGCLAMDQIAGLHIHPVNYDHTPNCTFTYPEVGSIGLTEREARKRGLDIKTATFPMSANGKAKIAQETDGLIKLVVDSKYNEVLGIHICGHHATDLISEGSIALHLEATADELMHAIHPHPTLSEIVGEVAHAIGLGSPLHF